jgi:hypothetical protein
MMTGLWLAMDIGNVRKHRFSAVLTSQATNWATAKNALADKGS